MANRNRGEHSELLALLRVLHNGKLQLADSAGKPQGSWLRVIAAKLPSPPADEFVICGENIEIRDSSGICRKVVPRSKIESLAEGLFKDIRTSVGASFSSSSADEAALLLEINDAKAPSKYKADILLTLASPVFEGRKLIQGFSVKSELGNPATLLNAGATVFKYHLKAPEGCDPWLVQESLMEPGSDDYPVPTKLFPELRRAGVELDFIGVENAQFEENLRMIDTSFPKMLAAVLVQFYFGNIGGRKNEEDSPLEVLLGSPELISKLALSLGLSEAFVAKLLVHKFKDLLRQAALGMKPSKPWGGEVEAHGGWIVVNRDGQVSCFHLVNDDEFRKYLLQSCRIERPSRSRHGTGYVCPPENGHPRELNLSLQVRCILRD